MPTGPSVPPAGAPLVAAITTFLADQDPETLDDIRHSLARALDEAGQGAIDSLCERLSPARPDWRYYPADPLARRIHGLLADLLLTPDSALVGVEHALAAGSGPLVIVAHHMSYADANLVEVLLRRSGAEALADRLAVVAGPKVYSSLQRRFSSLCFGTIRTPQSRTLSSEDAVMPAREVAQAARQSIDTALERLRLGDALLVFPEGTRSRFMSLQPLLPGVTRYFACDSVRILPVGIAGSEALFPIGEGAFRPVVVTTRIGRSFAAAELLDRAGADRRLAVDTIGLAIADQLSPPYRGAYGPEMPGLGPARALLNALS
jgi:1-acyl-sn-glycerol-3-phosphate acyltransferase